MIRPSCLFPALFLTLAACTGDRTVSAFAEQGASFRLTELDGRPFAAPATISFPAPGLVRGRGPCNSYSAAQKAPYPWFELGPLRATRRSCPDIAEERRFFEALAAMRLAETSGAFLILEDESAARRMFFVSVAPAGR